MKLGTVQIAETCVIECTANKAQPKTTVDVKDELNVLGRYSNRHVRYSELADSAHGHPVDRDVECPLQLQHPRFLLRRRHDLQQGEVHVVVVLVQPGCHHHLNFPIYFKEMIIAKKYLLTGQWLFLN